MLSLLTNSVAALVAVIVLLLGPGLLCARALRLRGLPALASATGLTCAIVGAAATLTTRGITTLRWTLPLLIAATALSALVAYGIGRLLPAPPAQDGHPLRRAAAIGTGLGTLSLGLALALSIRRLDSVPAQPDATYHLNSIRSILLGGDASSLDGGVFLYDRPHSYYPSTFHAIAASAAQLTGVQPIFMANAISVVSASLIWTLGCVLLCRQAFGRDRAALVLGGVASASFVAMPFWIAGYGPLWPLVLGYAILPGLLACLLSLFRLARRDLIGRPQATVLLVTTAGGLAFVHPAALAAVVLIAYPLLVMATVRSHRKSPRARAVVMVAIATVSVPLLWWAATLVPKIRGFTERYAAPPSEHARRAVYEILTNRPGGSAELWATSIVVLIGLVECFRRRRLWWVLATWLLLAGAFFVVAAVQSGLTRAVTVFWYNERPRLAALVPLAAVVVLTAGLLWLVTALRGRLARAGRPISPRLALTVVLVVYLVATLGNNIPAQVARLRPYYHPADPTTALLPVSRQHDLEVLARHVPRDGIVAVNPWRGHALLYAFGSRKVAFPSEKAVTTPDRQLVADQLYLAGSPLGGLVCGAVHRLGVGYVLTGGANVLTNSGGRDQFLGIDLVPQRPGFEEIARSGPYTLWRITACS